MVAYIRAQDPNGERIAGVLRETIDQLYDGQRTGRYKWEQLYKTEKTHCGSLVEINLQREFCYGDGKTLDFLIGGVEVDYKYSQTCGKWMIPPKQSMGFASCFGRKMENIPFGAWESFGLSARD